MTLVIAHRGASGYELENTLAAFRRASSMGAAGVELDVHSTADGQIVVHHDAYISGKPINTTTLEDLRKITLADGEPVPTLAEALNAIEGTAYIELKTLAKSADEELFRVIDESARGAAAASPEILSEHGSVRPSAHIHSFEHRLVRRLQGQRSDLTYGALSVAIPVHPENNWRDARVTEVWQHEETVNREFVELAHSRECKVFAWTTDDPVRMVELRDMGVDGICTNKPDVGLKCLK